MSTYSSRRNFIKQVGFAVAATAIPAATFASLVKETLPYKLGYASITWGGKDAQAIEEIASLGFKGIQLRANTVETYANKAGELKELLAKHKLLVPVFSSGNINVNVAEKQAHIDKHLKHARFLKEIGGGPFLQITNNARPKDRQPTTQELKDLGMLMTEIGKRTADLGITVAYHNHMNQLGETPEEVEQIMAASDPKYVKLLLDVAHYFQGGGDPAKAIVTYKDRIEAFHLKDVESPVPGKDDPKSYRFVELGQGKVNLPSVFAALKQVKFKSWAIVELDGVPDPVRTPLECARISKAYLEEKLGTKI
ncbi:sugar phosphate isomerase/epimerase [Rhodocytophaga rosea]|uniref:Sugar phosphate isomerase/epimerase n=1 Tax=Rhodocytophaga rosea TaxID=2704465 RepID=A0A6C0GEQ5_9BACT|nr:sugar phosphate isomerase/epimerase [Rhodocytophaga rosea]QHT66150.1 sugar phosphate isomerase/epimerase [Rhodocytophaga rosea]